MCRALAMLLVIVDCVALQSGCASPRGIVPIGNDKFVLVKHQVASYPGRFTFGTQIIQEASQHCAKSGKALNIVAAKELPERNVIVNYRWARIEFRCVPRRDSIRPEDPVDSTLFRNSA